MTSSFAYDVTLGVVASAVAAAFSVPLLGASSYCT